MTMADGKAQELNARGSRLSDQGWHAEAEEAYRAAAAAQPDWSVPWYNLGLMHKYLGNWEESFAATLRATELAPADVDSWWNLGIAATALDRWDDARRAWRGCDIDVPAGDGPIEMHLGPVPIRLNPDAEAEVVWARRIDPARAILESIPFPESGHRWGNLVLHDGAANGYRKLRGVDVPVFDELELLRSSDYLTFIAEIDSGGSDLDVLSEIARDMGGAAEDWSTNTRILCKQCSEGTPGHLVDADHLHPAHPHCGIAARDEAQALEILSAWQARVPEARVIACRCGWPGGASI